MGWKEILNIKTDNIISTEVDAYLKNIGFYEYRMSPRFFNNDSDYGRIQNEGAPCLRLDTDYPPDREYTLRIFVNAVELYIEVQTSYRSFQTSDYRYLKDENLTIERLDEILDSVLKEFQEG